MHSKHVIYDTGSVLSSYLLIKHIASAILGWLLYFDPKLKDLAMGNFFIELILRITFLCPCNVKLQKRFSKLT